ncbi:transmembrane 7 superfamily member 3-like isoform X2 [Ceratina calcarata]|uniref:Transmembrane 7 superfamily member 3-like isoform X2 n=1 Tax=Ceratina calcarata TaxID=156304 RepID=A0AAJ7RXA7_9HYME|nr:transmembrane 7 superfamily member 3-like isoform X2 [Ceratina calcarata]
MSVFGSNVGLFSRLTSNIMTQFFVKNDNPQTIEALLIAIPYNAKAPVPGGCNMEFATEIAPYARVQTLPELVVVDVQPPSMPLQSIALSKCGNTTNPVSVEIYQMFLTEQDFSSLGYFSAISSMLTVQDIKTNGIEVASASVMSPMRRVFSAYTGVGSVYVAVAKYGENYAAYVPAFSYACHPVVDPESCTILSGFFPQFICASCLLIGLLLIIFSYQHLVIVIDTMITIFFFGTVLGYISFASIGIALLISLGITALIVWLRSVTLVGRALHNIMTIGFFSACLVYYNSPDTFIAVHDNAIFWTLFVIIACSIGVGALCLLGLSHLATCSICTGLMVVLPIDYYAGSNLKYILINFIRRATVEDFYLASVQHPSQTKDIILIVLWSGLAFYHFARHGVGILTSGSETIPLLGV